MSLKVKVNFGGLHTVYVWKNIFALVVSGSNFIFVVSVINVYHILNCFCNYVLRASPRCSQQFDTFLIPYFTVPTYAQYIQISINVSTCILVTAVCVSVCPFITACLHYCMDPDVN